MFALNGQKQSIKDIAPSTVLYDFLRSSTSYTVRLFLLLIEIADRTEGFFRKPVSLYMSFHH